MYVYTGIRIHLNIDIYMNMFTSIRRLRSISWFILVLARCIISAMHVLISRSISAHVSMIANIETY